MSPVYHVVNKDLCKNAKFCIVHLGFHPSGLSLIVHSCVKMTQIRLLINQSLNDCYSLE